ncbi:MAG: cytochrome b/b6 domain-containing protein [Bacteriovorax sp.]|nr:cytochrome b/b6 domain-containing protein [Bacteriovorax sp.]
MNCNKILIKEKHSLILRCTHWINFVFLSLMIWSGILIYWANDQYIKIPTWVAQNFSIRFRLAEGMGWHFFIMWGFCLNGIIYVLYMILSKQWKELTLDRKTLSQAIEVVLHDLKIKKEAPSFIGKFNAAQRVAYFLAIFMGLSSVITGLAIYKPVTLGALTTLLGGYKAARFEHFLLMLGFLIFFIIHIIQVARAGWNNFRSMVAGYEIEKD